MTRLIAAVALFLVACSVPSRDAEQPSAPGPKAPVASTAEPRVASNGSKPWYCKDHPEVAPWCLESESRCEDFRLDNPAWGKCYKRADAACFVYRSASNPVDVLLCSTAMTYCMERLAWFAPQVNEWRVIYTCSVVENR